MTVGFLLKFAILTLALGGEGVSAHDATGSPSRFVSNCGQWTDDIHYLGELPGMLVRVEHRSIALQLSGSSDGAAGVLVRILFEGCSTSTIVEGDGEREGSHNFFLGNDPRKWVAGARAFDRVRYRNLYPGIDLVLRLQGGRLKYDLEVAPNADVESFVMRFEGIEDLRPRGDGTPVASTDIGSLVQLPGRSWQTQPSGEQREVSVTWHEVGENGLGMGVPERDPSLPLVIDPELVWSTYLGSSFGDSTGDWINDVAYDPAGYVVVVGKTDGPDSFPQTPGAYQSPGVAPENVFVTKFRNDDGALVYSSVFGGLGNPQRGIAVSVDPSGRATVVGITTAPDFPVTPGAFDTHKDSNTTSFVTQLTELGDGLVFSTFIEGTFGGGTDIRAVVSDACGVVVAGQTAALDFPTTPGVFQETYSAAGDAFITRFDSLGSALTWSTLLGGVGGDEATALALDPSGDVFITGTTSSDEFPTTPGAFSATLAGARDVFIARVSARGDQLRWSTFYGGPGFLEIPNVVAVAANETVVIAGSTSSNIPTTPGAHQTEKGFSGYQGFVTCLNPMTQELIYSTYIGGTAPVSILGGAVDPSGVVTVSGRATHGGALVFPTTPGAYDATGFSGENVHVVRLSPHGDRLFYSSFVGGPSSEAGLGLAVSPTGRATLVGQVFSPGGYPTTVNALQPTFMGGQADGFVTTMDLYLEGVEPTVSSTPGCRGPLALNATEMPVAGNAGFAVYCSAAPSLAQGELRIRRHPLQGFTSLPSGSLTLEARGVVERIRVIADASGYVETPFPLTSHSPGEKIEFRYVFRNPASCPAPIGSGSCASNGLLVTVQ